jgi:DNA invertase Pin-like site-specific DNA recombinase
MNEKILPINRDRRAVVYLRQSTIKQVHENVESTRRQYGLKERAIALGWPSDNVDVIDEDLGQSGTSVECREGFQRLAEAVAQGRVGAIFALEISRLARSSADWHRLLDLCRLTDVQIIDEQAVYTPRDYNDRLLLGLKGTMSEAEQYWMRLRLDGGRLNKARRGEYRFTPPAGYIWDKELPGFRLDPNEEVQRSIRLVFQQFRLEQSAYGVMRYLASQGIILPARDLTSRELRWGPARYTLVLGVLHNPIYAGAYVYGRYESQTVLIDGQIQKARVRKLAMSDWKVCLKDQHPAYISWEEFMSNQRTLEENGTNSQAVEKRGAPRQGAALLQGVALCGRCGRRMSVRYAPKGKVVYQCIPNEVQKSLCWTVMGDPIDNAVAQLFLETVTPPEIELSMAVAQEAERQSDAVARQWRLRLERAHYEAQLAERRYKAVDPDNRVVARTLECDWEEKLRNIEALNEEYASVCRKEKVVLTEADRARILSLAKDLKRVWNAKSTTAAEQKNLLRMLIQEVTLVPVEIPKRATLIRILWKTEAVSEITIERPSKLTAQATSNEVLLLLRSLFEKQLSDEVIATKLNDRGMRTARDKQWTATSVQRIRSTYGWRRTSPKARHVPNQRADGLYSTHGIAAEFNVTPGVVQYWASKGLLPTVEKGGRGRPHWFKLDDATKERLEAAKTKGYCRADVIANEIPTDLITDEVHHE